MFRFKMAAKNEVSFCDLAYFSHVTKIWKKK